MVDHPRRDALAGGTQPHARMAHAGDGLLAVGEALRGEVAEHRLGHAVLDAGRHLVQIGEGARGEDVLGRAVEVERRCPTAPRGPCATARHCRPCAWPPRRRG